MAAQRSVVKHSYLTGKDKGVGKAQAHVRYIQFRGGKDKDEETRSFFNGSRDGISGREVAAAVSDQNPRGTVMHKLILSPGVQGADVKEYCREVMSDLASRKGLELEWYAVRHDNTAHPHVHIVVMGTDENGHKVRLMKDDYTKIKEAGDRYLERNRLLDREEKDKERDNDREQRNPVGRFVDALKAAAKEFSREMNRDKQPDRKETKFEQRRREREEERQKEIDSLGETIDLDAYLVQQAAKEERDQEKKDRAWKAYCKPINVNLEREDGTAEQKSYDRSSSLSALKELERAYQNADPSVRDSMTEKDQSRLGDWIKEKYRDEKRIENKADKLEKVDLELDDGTKRTWTKNSSVEDLRKLESLNGRGDVYLDDAEKRALTNWLNAQELKQPIKIQLELDSEPLIYDREDSKESLQFLAGEYAKGAPWARENLDGKDYRKVKTWIGEKDKDRVPEKEHEDKEDRLKIGNKFVSKDMDADALRHVREEAAKSPEKNKQNIERLDSWITAREADENKDPDKKDTRRHKRTASEKSMDRAVRVDRMDRWNNYYKEKSEQKEQLEGQRENLKAQKRALNKYEKERETVDGQYSEIWGADKSAIAAGPMGAASGGLRPLGANQFVKLISQATKQHMARQKFDREEASKTQKVLENRLTEDKKTDKPAEKPPEKTTDKTADKPKGEKPEKTEIKEPAREKEPTPIDNSGLATEARELEQDVKNKKKKEQDRDQRPGSDREKEDPFMFDPWGRF